MATAAPSTTATTSSSAAVPLQGSTPAFPALGVVAESELGFALHPVDNALFVTVEDDLTRVLFAVAEPEGLREVPELAHGLNLGKNVQTIDRLIGTWPGTLWLQTLDVDADRVPADPDWTTRFFRYDPGGWRTVGNVKTNTLYRAVWLAGPRCLVGIQGHNNVAGAARRPADCPDRRIPVVPLDDPRNAYLMRLAAASRSGDAFVLEQSTSETPRFRVEILGNQDAPKRRLAPLPLPVEVEADRLEFSVGPKSLVVHSATEAYLGGRLRPKGSPVNPPKDAIDSPKETSVLFRFDGIDWSVLETPPITGVPLFTVAKDGTVIIAARGAENEEDFALWFRLPTGTWERRNTFRSQSGGRCGPYEIWARSPNDVWVACGTPRGPAHRTRVVHTGEMKLVWRPSKEGAH